MIIGCFLLSSFWFWTCLEIIAGLLVAAGCWGEWYLFKNPAGDGDESAKRIHHSREVRCIIAVAIGVTVEFAALAHSIPEAVRLEKDVVQIGTTNVQLSLRVEELRSNNIALELKLQPRRITQNQIVKFIDLLRNRPKCPVKVCVGVADNETQNYAQQIRGMLDEAGYGTGKADDIVVERNHTLFFPADDPTRDLPLHIIIFGAPSEIVNLQGTKIDFSRNDKTAVFYDEQTSCFGNIDAALNEIGIHHAVEARTNMFVYKSGEWAIVIPEKF